MAYITAITDRTQADIAARNSKAFFNVVDWVRVYENSVEVNTLFVANLYPISFDTLTTVTDVDIPTTDTTLPINPMLANIERMRLWAATYLSAYITDSSLFVEIKDDWLPGQSNPAPTFTDVNLWEKVLDLLHDYLDPYVPPTISGDWKWEDGTSWELEASGNWQHE